MSDSYASRSRHYAKWGRWKAVGCNYLIFARCFVSHWDNVSLPAELPEIGPMEPEDIEVAFKNTRPSSHLHGHRCEKFNEYGTLILHWSMIKTIPQKANVFIFLLPLFFSVTYSPLEVYTDVYSLILFSEPGIWYWYRIHRSVPQEHATKSSVWLSASDSKCKL